MQVMIVATGYLLVLGACLIPGIIAPGGDLQYELHPGTNYKEGLLNINVDNMPEVRNTPEAQAELDAIHRREAEKKEFLKALPHVLACFASVGGPCIQNDPQLLKQIIEQKCSAPPPKQRPQYTAFRQCAVPEGMSKAAKQFFATHTNAVQTAVDLFSMHMCDPDFGLQQQPNPSKEMDEQLCKRITAVVKGTSQPTPKGATKVFALSAPKAQLFKD